MPLKDPRVRVPGSAFTVFKWGTEIIAFADQVAVTSVVPVADAVAIQPLNAVRPVEIVTPGAHREGRIVMTLTELYNHAVWQRLAGLTGAQDVSDIMRIIASLGRGVSISKVVTPPSGISEGPYSETFFNCVITRVQDDEAIRIDTMFLNKEIEVWFTHSKKFNYTDMDQASGGLPVTGGTGDVRQTVTIQPA